MGGICNDNTDRAYRRASPAHLSDYKITVDWEISEARTHRTSLAPEIAVYYVRISSFNPVPFRTGGAFNRRKQWRPSHPVRRARKPQTIHLARCRVERSRRRKRASLADRASCPGSNAPMGCRSKNGSARSDASSAWSNVFKSRTSAPSRCSPNFVSPIPRARTATVWPFAAAIWATTFVLVRTSPPIHSGLASMSSSHWQRWYGAAAVRLRSRPGFSRPTAKCFCTMARSGKSVFAPLARVRRHWFSWRPNSSDRTASCCRTNTRCSIAF